MLCDLVMKNAVTVHLTRAVQSHRGVVRLCGPGAAHPSATTVSRSATGWCTKEEATLSCRLPAAALVNVKLPPEGHAPTAYIVICCDTTVEPNTTRVLRDIGISAQTIMLAATEVGLGGCMIGSFSPDRVSTALNIPEKYRPMLVLALGKPDEKVELIEAVDGNVTYYRKNGIHYVPKRTLEDIII